jgi:calcineurin-like phosphoesterase
VRVLVIKAIAVFLGIGAAYLALSIALRLRQDSPTCEVPVIVEVLNGCGIKGIAEDVAQRLRSRGFDVMFVGNADDFSFQETLVVDRSGDRDKAFTVADALGVTDVIHQVRSAFFVDVTVVVGGDLAETGEGDV